MKLKLVLLLILCLSLPVLYFSVVIPDSVKIYMAAVAGCDIPEERIKQQDPNFEAVKWWETPLAHIYRVRYSYFSTEMILNDSLVEDISVLNALITTSQNNFGVCDAQILPMFKTFIQAGAPVNHYTDQGLTVLHEAILFEKVEFVEALTNGGADTSQTVKYDGVISGKNAVELATFLAEKNRSAALTAITAILKKPIKL